ncbi:MAG: hypothetical protein IT373_17525 [Polyangiaceae bacterium]|nr:hypothetical protein [Polyangiaceae bacterium]
MKTTRLLRTTVCLALLLLAGCVATPDDTRPPLSECEHGLYWAECGGTGEPVLGCDRETGDCRWFSGGVTARGHAVSDCPTTEACCHDQWPFTDFAPTGRVLEHARDQLSLLGNTMITRRGASSVISVADLASHVRWPVIRCEPAATPRFPGCEVMGEGATLAQVGKSILIRFDQVLLRIDMEITPAEALEQWVVQLFLFRAFSPRDGPPQLWCQNYSVGEELSVSGVLHLSTTDTSDLTTFHGRLDGVDSRGAAFTMEF